MAERSLHEDQEYAVKRLIDATSELPMQELLRQLMYATVASVTLVKALEDAVKLPPGFIDGWIRELAMESRKDG
jgi:hypothetical protein